MDILDEEFICFWRLLNANNVRYIVVGELATKLHGGSNTSSIIQIWIEDNLINRQNLRKAFRELNYGDYESIETMQFLQNSMYFRAGWMDLQILTEVKGIDTQSFEICHQSASLCDIDGIVISFLHVNDLIASKKAINNAKDKIDVLELEKIKKIREKERR
jgi:hypothetical protein